MDEKFAGGKFREIPLAVDIIFAGGKFREKSKFAKIAKLNSTRKIGVIQYMDLAVTKHYNYYNYSAVETQVLLTQLLETTSFRL